MEALEILAKYREVVLREERQRKLWKKCFEYVNNSVDGEHGQWQQEVRKELSAQGRPVVSFNIIKKYVNRICGAQAATKLDEKCYPRDDQSDPLVADILSDLIKYVKDVNDAEIAIARMFRDGIICGRGFIKSEWSDELDPMGEITLKTINPMRLYLLGEGENYDISKDRSGIIEEIPMDKEEIILRWPKAEKDIESLNAEIDEKDGLAVSKTYDYGFGLNVPSEYVFDKEERKLKVLRFQKMMRKKVKWLREPGKAPTQAPEKKEDFDLALQLSQTNGIQLEESESIVKYVQVTYVLGNILLEDKQSVYRHGGYDLTGFFCYYDNGYITGVVQDLLDPQDEKNKRRSQAIHLMGTAAKNSHFVRKGAIADINLARKEMGKTGALIEVNGEPRQATAPIESNTTAVPALIQMELQSSSDMKDISGLNDASLGIVPEGVKSGRGIQALQLPSETMVSEIFDHYYSTRKAIFKKVLSMIQQFYDEPRRVRILGDYSSKLLPPQVQDMKAQLVQKLLTTGVPEVDAIMQADQMIQVSDGSKVISINQQIAGQKLNDVTVGRYDVVIDEVSQNPTTRRQQYQDMLNMRAMGIPIADDLLIKYSDIRGKEEILQKLQETKQMMMTEQLLMQKKPNTASPPGGAQPEDQMVNQAGVQL